MMGDGGASGERTAGRELMPSLLASAGPVQLTTNFRATDGPYSPTQRGFEIMRTASALDKTQIWPQTQ